VTVTVTQNSLFMSSIQSCFWINACNWWMCEFTKGHVFYCVMWPSSKLWSMYIQQLAFSFS